MRLTKCKLLVVTAISVLAFLSGCAVEQVAKETNMDELKTPIKHILISSGDLNKPYDILGGVNCTLNGKSLYRTEQVAAREIDDALRKVAFSLYGDNVDAIINAHHTSSVNGGFWGTMAGAYGAPTGTISASGIAVHFK